MKLGDTVTYYLTQEERTMCGRRAVDAQVVEIRGDGVSLETYRISDARRIIDAIRGDGPGQYDPHEAKIGPVDAPAPTIDAVPAEAPSDAMAPILEPAAVDPEPVVIPGKAKK